MMERQQHAADLTEVSHTLRATLYTALHILAHYLVSTTICSCLLMCIAAADPLVGFGAPG